MGNPGTVCEKTDNPHHRNGQNRGNDYQRFHGQNLLQISTPFVLWQTRGFRETGKHTAQINGLGSNSSVCLPGTGNRNRIPDFQVGNGCGLGFIDRRRSGVSDDTAAAVCRLDGNGTIVERRDFTDDRPEDLPGIPGTA